MKKFNFRNLLNKFSVNRYAKIFAIVPAVVVLIAVLVVVGVGAPTGAYSDAVGIGIDFEGGTLLTVTLGEEAANNYDECRINITETIESFGVRVSYTQRQATDRVDDTAIVFRYKNISNNDAEITELNEKIRTAVDELYPDMPNNVRYESIGATAAKDLLQKAGIALAVSVAIILVYIIIRFTLMSGFAAIIALIHDVVIMFALTVICRVQINSSYVAAMITIIAYSINNTIIIFDRCRESLKDVKASGQKYIDYKGIGDMAVRDTMTRSLYTTLTTMITVIFLAILGSESIREFCVPIILGLIAGLYSSVCLATPLWAAMSISFDKTKAKYLKRNKVVYDKKDSEEDVVEEPKASGAEADEIAPSSVRTAGDSKPKKKKAPNTYVNPKKKKKTVSQPDAQAEESVAEDADASDIEPTSDESEEN